jgi:hypothetical protein
MAAERPGMQRMRGKVLAMVRGMFQYLSARGDRRLMNGGQLSKI